MEYEMAASPEMNARSAYRSYQTLKEIVFHELLQDIIGARFAPGERLVESRLAALYGVSRGPVREAIRLLEGQGLVRYVPGKGTVASQLTRFEVREIYDIRIDLEGQAAALGTGGIKTRQLQAMERLLHRMTGALNVPDRWLKLNDEFHMALYAASERQRLASLIRDHMNLTLPYALLYLNAPEQIRTSHADHPRLFEAVADGDAPRAREITREHLKYSSGVIVALVGEAGEIDIAE